MDSEADRAVRSLLGDEGGRAQIPRGFVGCAKK